MIHHLKSDDLDTLQRFAKLFDVNQNPALTKTELQYEGNGFHFLAAKYNAMNSKGIGRGYGLHPNRLHAAFGALGEAIERYAFTRTKPDYRALSYRRLKEKRLAALDPDTFKIFAGEQEAMRAGQVFQPSRDSSLDWTWFEKGLSGKKILLPSQFNGFPIPNSPIYFLSCTNGNACATTPIKAKLSATLESLERDGVMFYWWTRNTPRQIDLSNPEPRLKEILARFRNCLDHVTLFFLETDLKTSTVMAVYRSNDQPYLQISAACRLDPVSAIEKALAEMVHALEFFRSARASFAPIDYGSDFERSIWGFEDHSFLYGLRPLPKAYSFLFEGSRAKIHYSDMPNLETGNTKRNLALMANEFKRNGLRLYFKNLSERDLRSAGLFVYRAFSPDLAAIEAHHKLRQVGVPRLYQLGKKLGLKRQSRSFHDLNPFPHPFP